MNEKSEDLKPRHVDYLTGLKGFACLVVSFNHFAGMFTDRMVFPWTRFPWAFIFNGTFLVSVFYLLSSFFIAYSFFKKEDFSKLGQTLFCRSFRLILPIFFTCILIWGLMKLGAYASYEAVREITNSTRSESDALNYFTSYSFIDTFTVSFSSIYKSTTKLTFVFWMLPQLYKGFFITIFIMLIMNTLKPIAAVITACTACFFINWLMGTGYVIFAVGVLFAFIYTRYDKIFTYTFSIVGGGCCLPVFFYLSSYYPRV